MDSQNDISQQVVDARNDIGQGIVDAQNAIGQQVVGEFKSFGSILAICFFCSAKFNTSNYVILMPITTFTDTSNYITQQHNTLSDWLHGNLCIIYKALNGSCDRAIGPLNEDQAHIPMQLYWPEGQPTLIERLEQFQTHLSLPVSDDLHVDDKTAGDEGIGRNKHVVMNALSKEMKDQFVAVEAKVVGAVTDLVESKVKTLSQEMQGKEDAVNAKVDAMKDELKDMKDDFKDVKDELKEVKDLLYKMMAAMTKDKE